MRQVSKNFFDLFFLGKKFNGEERIGYIFKVKPAGEGWNEYRLLKTKEGKWLQKGEARFQVGEDNDITLHIKKEIDNHENQ